MFECAFCAKLLCGDDQFEHQVSYLDLLLSWHSGRILDVRTRCHFHIYSRINCRSIVVDWSGFPMS